MSDEVKEVSWLQFTEEERTRGYELAKPFNDKFHVNPNDDPNYGNLMADNRISDHSMSMFARWADKDGFIFSVDDDLTGTTLEVVHEKDLETFLAERTCAAKH
jgi:hypothetical protein